MDNPFDLLATKLGEGEKTALASFCDELDAGLKENLRSITLYGSATREDYLPGHSDINVLVVVEQIDIMSLNRVLDPTARYRRYGIVPFFLSEYDLCSSADIFPVKFLEMQESYIVLWGSDVLRELEISREHLRFRCEQEVKNLLLRLRRHYIMNGGHKLIEIMARIISGFLKTLRLAVSLHQENLPQRRDVIEAAAKAFAIDADTLRRVKDLRYEDVSISRDEAEQLFGRFMALVEKVAKITDKM
ncbi:MAG: hypothetical protein JSV88_12110 [Candidatus Aminicenantes bacterium]|nr:MAG: hypothetical protein JSV88_12110 [Candidatus Aminicenantes bacterium]